MKFSIHYQPIIDVKSGEIVKAEALLRWDCDALGSISTEYFIPIAEDAGLIVAIGSWVIQSACLQVKKWRDAGWDDICVTVNVSAYQFQPKTGLVAILEKALKENALAADSIQLELTEEVLAKDANNIAETIKQLQLMGIKLLINNVGEGLTSLSILQEYDFDSIKISRRYIENMLVSEKDKKLVKAIIAMTKGLGMTVISEGIETKEQSDFMVNEQCEYMQGYYFSKPVPPDEFILLSKITHKNLSEQAELFEFIPDPCLSQGLMNAEESCCDVKL